MSASVVVITTPLSRNRGKTRTAIQVYADNLTEIRLEIRTVSRSTDCLIIRILIFFLDFCVKSLRLPIVQFVSCPYVTLKNLISQ